MYFDFKMIILEFVWILKSFLEFINLIELDIDTIRRIWTIFWFSNEFHLFFWIFPTVRWSQKKEN